MPRAKKQNRKDNRYQIIRVIGHYPDGTPIRKSFYGKNKDEALLKYHEFKLEINRQKEEKENMPFNKWAETWLYTYKEPDVKGSTFNSTYYRPVSLHLIPHFDNIPLKNITQADIKEYFNNKREMSFSALQKDFICLKGIFETAIDNDLIEKNPCRNIKIKSTQEKQKKSTYDKETVDRLCSIQHQYTLIINLLLKLGLRASELCGLKWENINIQEKTIYIDNSITVESGIKYEGKPKTDNSIRKLPLSENLIDLLEKEPKTCPYLVHKENRSITPTQLYVKIGVFYNNANIPKDKRLSPHELRHTCGTLLYKETKDIYHVSRFLGHSDIGITTKIYVHSEMQQEEIHIDF